MYKSRIKKTAGSLTVAVDSQNGELLSLVDENSGDNLIKNSSYTLPNPFALTIGGLTLTAPSNTEIKKTPALAPEVREGASSITIVYPMLTDGVRFFDITVDRTFLVVSIVRNFLSTCRTAAPAASTNAASPASTACSTAKATRTIRSSIRTMPG